MKVYQINSVCGTGSTGKIACDLADVLQKKGSQSRIAYGRGSSNRENTFRFESDTGVMLHGVLSRITDRHAFYSAAATKKLIADIKNFAPDIIHLHNLHGYYVHIGLLFDFLKQYDKPVVWTLHDCWTFTGHCAQFDRIGCDKWKTQCSACPQKKEYPASLLLDGSEHNYKDKKRLFTSLDKLTVVTPSEWLADLAKQSYLGKYDVRVIPNGIDLSVFKPTHEDIRTQYGLQDKRILLGVAGVWTEQKGLPDFGIMAENLPDGYQIVLVGLTKKQIAQLPDGIVGIERTENAKQLATLYTQAHAFLNPTYEDTFPTTNLEALACGTPVFTYQTGGSGESVAEGCGAVIPKTNNIKQNALLLMQAACEATPDRKACLQHTQTFDKFAQFEKYISLYGALTAAQ